MSIFNKNTDIDNHGDSPAVDAVVNVSLANRGLEAYLNIEPPRKGGAAPALEALEKALSGCGVSYNVNMEKLKELAKEPVYNCDILIARGVAPIDGVDGTATFHFETEKKGLKPKEREDGTVDFQDLGIVENVSRGQVLCTITPPTQGTPGISVKGEVLHQKKGRQVPSYVGKNTELNEDGTAILAKIDGQVDFDGRKINVYETFNVNGNVGNATGNIKVAGNLVVRGMVLPGFKIEAGGNIDVVGTVEASTIKAEGSVKLQSGITGSELYCEGDLKSRFIENCNVFVKGDIIAEYILNSNIKCGKSLKVVGSIAKIIGGSCVAGQDIEARTIGSVANVKTNLELGTDSTVIVRQQELTAQVSELQKQIESLKPLITLLRQLEADNRLPPEKKQILDNIGPVYDNSIKLKEEAEKELEEISQSIKDRGFGRIICTGTIYPGTKVVMGDAVFTVTNTLNNTYLYYNKGVIGQGIAR